MAKSLLTRKQIKQFLDRAVIDPNGTMISQEIINQGEPSYFETRIVEYMGEAKRLRDRMKSSSGQQLTTLREAYNTTLTNAATYLAIAAGKVNYGPDPTETKTRAGSKDSG